MIDRPDYSDVEGPEPFQSGGQIAVTRFSVVST